MRRGFLLIEAVLALLVLAAIGSAALSLLMQSAKSGARYGAEQVAARMAARLIDTACSPGHDGLAPAAGLSGPVDLTVRTWCVAPEEPPALEVDGLEFAARVEVQVAAPGLLRVIATLAWRPVGDAREESVHNVTLTRLIADPGAALHVREPLPIGGRV